MGITIHYTAIASDYDKLSELIYGVSVIAKVAGYPVSRIKMNCKLTTSGICMERLDKDVESYLNSKWLKVIYAPVDEWHKYIEPYGFIDPSGCYGSWSVIYNNKYRYRNAIPSRIEGVIVSNPTSESFNFTWYKLGRYWVLDNFTKTQPFSIDEVKPNIRFHKFISSILKYIKERREEYGIIKLYVYDEGGYYNTGDIQKLIENFDLNYQLIEAFAKALNKIGWKYGFRAEIGGRGDDDAR